VRPGREFFQLEKEVIDAHLPILRVTLAQAGRVILPQSIFFFKAVKWDDELLRNNGSFKENTNIRRLPR
jgi:hypothetical protein